MTKATSETTKLNFITDQGSTRATVRCACRAVRFDCPFFPFWPGFRIVTAPSAATVLPAPVVPVLADAEAAAADPIAVVPDRRNVRADDDGELGGGSGISNANAAGDTDGGSAGAGGTVADGRPEGPGPEGTVPDDPMPEDPGPEGAGRAGAVGTGAVGDASSPDGSTADSAGSA